MNIKEILSVEKWAEFERKVNSTLGLNASVFDATSIKVTGFKKRANGLCRAIQSNPKGRSLICMVAHQNLSRQARQTQKPVFAECDAGLLKLVVPIFLYGEFLGVFSGCGLLVDDGMVETFLIHKTTGINIGEVDRLCNDIVTVKRDKIPSIVEYLMHCINAVVGDFHTIRNQPHKLSNVI